MSWRIVFFVAFMILAATMAFHNALTRLSYGIKIDGDHLIEFGLFTKKRRLPVSSVTKVLKGEYRITDISRVVKLPEHMLVIVERILMSLTRSRYKQTIAMVAINGSNDFPKFPINPDIVGALIEMNPAIEVDPDLGDLLLSSTREKLGIKLTFLGIVGRVIGYVLYAILALFVLFFALIFGLFVLDILGVIHVR